MTTAPTTEHREVEINGESYNETWVDDRLAYTVANRFDNGVDLFTNSPENDAEQAARKPAALEPVEWIVLAVLFLLAVIVVIVMVYNVGPSR